MLNIGLYIENTFTFVFELEGTFIEPPKVVGNPIKSFSRLDFGLGSHITCLKYQHIHIYVCMLPDWWYRKELYNPSKINYLNYSISWMKFFYVNRTAFEYEILDIIYMTGEIITDMINIYITALAKIIKWKI